MRKVLLVLFLGCGSLGAAPTEITGTVDLDTTGDVTYEGITGSGTITNSRATLRTVTVSIPAAGTVKFSGKIAGNVRLVVDSAAAGCIQQFDSSVSTYTGGTLIRRGELRTEDVTTRFGTAAIELAAASSALDASLCYAKVAKTEWPNDLIVSGAGGRLRQWNYGLLTLQKLTILDGATLRKSDTGANRFRSLDPSSRGTIYCSDGKNPLYLGEDFFGTGTTLTPVALTGLSATQIYAEGRLELPEITISGTSAFTMPDTASGYANPEADVAGPVRAGFAFRTLKVTADTTTVTAPVVWLASGTARTDFIVGEGAQLTIDAALGGTLDGTPKGFFKSGPGTLVLNGMVGANAPIWVHEGTLEMSSNAFLNAQSGIVCAPGARIRLRENAVLAGLGQAPDNVHTGFLATADVWFDAATLPYGTGATIASAPNHGRAGGSFYRPTGINETSYTVEGFHGKPSLVQTTTSAGLFLDTYTNLTDQITTFLVYQWDSWSKTSEGSGSWGSPFSLSTCQGESGKEDKQYASLVYSFGELGSSGDMTYQFAHDTKVFCCGTSWNIDLSDAAYAYEPGQMSVLGFRRNGTVTRSFGRIPAGTYDIAHTSGNTTKFQIERVALGKRMKGNGSYTWGRGVVGKIGEFLVFSRALTDDEVAYVNAYLAKKWYGLGDGGTEPAYTPVPTVVPEATEATVDVPTGETAAAVDTVTGSDCGVRLSKTGGGRLALAGNATNLVSLTGEAGTLALSAGSGLSRALLWVDPSDAATVTEEGGKVVAVRDKGRHGLVWTPTYNVSGPTVNRGALNGRDVFRYDGSAALSISNTTLFTAATQPVRNLHVYAILRRTAVQRWGGPFSFSCYSDVPNLYDNGIGGAGFHYEDEYPVGVAPTNTFFTGVNSWGTPSRYANDETVLFVSHQTDIECFSAWEKPSDDGLIPVGYKKVAMNPVRANMVQLGGRIGAYGGAYIGKSPYGDGNRMWHGDIGEFIVFDRKLPPADEAGLIAYLRKKWLDKGTGPDVPPACLTGASGALELSGTAAVSLAAGTTLAVSAGTQTVGSLALAEGVTLACEKDLVAADLPLFDVSGPLVLGATAAFIYRNAKGVEGPLIAAGTRQGSPAWTVVGVKPKKAVVQNASAGVWFGARSCTVIFYR